MPPRSRPTARILTPAGWLGLAAVIALVVGAVYLTLNPLG